MTYIQIICNPTDWDASTITACGMPCNGRIMTPRSIEAARLTEPYLSMWHGLVTALRGIAPGEWAATLIVATRTTRDDTPADATAVPVLQPVVRLTVHRQWDDGTTEEPVTLDMDAEHALALYDYLTNQKTYESD